MKTLGARSRSDGVRRAAATAERRGNRTSEIMDHRPVTVLQRQLQTAVHNSAQSEKMATLQALMNRKPTAFSGLMQRKPVVQRLLSKIKPPTAVDLNEHERAGGHTIDRHVGKSVDFIKNRVIDQTLDAASTFPDLPTAETVVGGAIDSNSSEINNIVFAPQAGAANRAFQYEAGTDIGSYLKYGNVVDKKGRTRKRNSLRDDATTATLVIRMNWQPAPPHHFYVLTCYPNPK